MQWFRVFLLILLLAASVRAAGPVRELSWDDIAAPVQQLLSRHGIGSENFRERTAALRRRNQVRVREGDLDHLIHYVLQSTSFTRLPPIEPALSAKELVSSAGIPAAVQARIDAFAAAAASRRDFGPRMAIFRGMLVSQPVDLPAEYVRTMTFVAPVGADYLERGLSTDTSIEASYAVYLALAALRRLEPERQVRTVLIVGPGLDLAPRTGLLEAGAPQSYQPFAVMDALIATGLSRRDDLRVTAADINPRVSDWVRRVRGARPTLSLISGIAHRGRVQLSDDYRAYFASVGRAIGTERNIGRRPAGHLGKSIVVGPDLSSAIDAATLDITIERIDAQFDLAVVTNVFPYLSDVELLLAVSNTAAMLKLGGVLIHNEPRPVLADALLALDLGLLQSRSGVVAHVQGTDPLYDTAWLHRSQ